MAIFGFFKMATVRHIGLLQAHWDHPRRLLGGLCITVQNLVEIDIVVSTVWMFITFCVLVLKTPIHSPKIRDLEFLTT